LGGQTREAATAAAVWSFWKGGKGKGRKKAARKKMEKKKKAGRFVTKYTKLRFLGGLKEKPNLFHRSK